MSKTENEELGLIPSRFPLGDQPQQGGSSGPAKLLVVRGSGMTQSTPMIGSKKINVKSCPNIFSTNVKRPRRALIGCWMRAGVSVVGMGLLRKQFFSEGATDTPSPSYCF